MKVNFLTLIFGFAAIGSFFQACSPAGGTNPGHEYMPDMAHSIAYETNVYNDYSLNRWNVESVKDLKELSIPRMPVKGTMPRGYAGMSSDLVKSSMNGQHSTQGIAIKPNGFVPYYYGDTEEERTRAMNEIIKNPFPITSKGLEHGKELYLIYCGICHGEKGDGQGYLVRDGGKYPSQPANLVSAPFVASSNGRYYHAIMYGKNVMGSYADKLSYEERWNVIHYIRSLQAKSLTLEYSEKKNTLNTVDMPLAMVQKPAVIVQQEPIEATAPVEKKEDQGGKQSGH